MSTVDPLRSGAIFRCDIEKIRSPLPRAAGHGAAAGAPAPARGPAAALMAAPAPGGRISSDFADLIAMSPVPHSVRPPARSLPPPKNAPAKVTAGSLGVLKVLGLEGSPRAQALQGLGAAAEVTPPKAPAPRCDARDFKSAGRTPRPAGGGGLLAGYKAPPAKKAKKRPAAKAPPPKRAPTWPEKATPEKAAPEKAARPAAATPPARPPAAATPPAKKRPAATPPAKKRPAPADDYDFPGLPSDDEFGDFVGAAARGPRPAKKRRVAPPEPRKNAPREAASPKKAKAASPAKKKKAAPASPAKKPKKAAKKTTAPRPTAAPTRKPAAEKKKKAPKAPRVPAAAEVTTPVVTTTRSGRRSFGALDWWRSERIVVRPGQNAVVVAGSAAAEDYLGAAKSF